MTPDFWRTIDRTRPDGRDPAGHAAALTEHLTAAGVESTLRFAESFDRAVDALYTWELWGAAYLALGGCGDDAFEYLRGWIIGAGDVIWTLAASDPEALFLHLLDAEEDPEQRWADLAFEDGEHLFYAAGTAHERLTGDWVPAGVSARPTTPVGVEWEETDLPHLYPELAAALPDSWFDSVDAAPSPEVEVMLTTERGITAFLDGDHDGARAAAEELVGDASKWNLVAEEQRVDVAYIAGIGRLLGGDVEGAALALHLVDTELDEAPHVRRALAQVELARGDLTDARKWIDFSVDAERLDRVLAAKLAWRVGNREEAVDRARQEMHAPIAADDHPWDVAGCIYQAAQVLCEAEDGEWAQIALQSLPFFLTDAPDDLPLLQHIRLLEIAVARVRGETTGLIARLEALCAESSGSDRAECLRERGRVWRTLGDAAEAATDFQAAAEEFERAGERWEAAVTREEAAR